MKKTIFSIIVLASFFAFLATSQSNTNRAGGTIPAFSPDVSISQSNRIATLMPNGQISVYLHSSGEVVYMDFDEYLAGVIAAEMPASFELDAIRAQAVAARSFILYRMQIYREHAAPSEHNGADSCTNFAHCVAWISMEDARERWGDNANYYEWRIREAVRSTSGEYMTFNGNVVRAFFFAMSNGWTENVEDVWSEAIPYLRSVESGNYDDLPNFETFAEFSVEEFVNRLRTERPNLLVGEALSTALNEPNRTAGGRVGTIQIGNQTFRGTDIRRVFGLRSADFDISTDDENVYFTVRGFGHGVGMSQRGANRLAQEGMGYREILKIYYTGIEIVR